MICNACREAADYADGGGLAAYLGSGDIEADLAEEAATILRLHGRCPGATACDCQHRVPAPEPAR